MSRICLSALGGLRREIARGGISSLVRMSIADVTLGLVATLLTPHVREGIATVCRG